MDYKILISEKEILEKTDMLGKEISLDYKDKSPLLICILKGAVVFFGDLIKKITTPVCGMEFVKIKSYDGDKSGNIKILSEIPNVMGKDVLIIEDIIDTGKTLACFIEKLKEQNPTSVKVCTLLNKSENRIKNIQPDYTGFNIKNVFVVGYGLDYNEKLRELPFVAELKL